MLYGPFLYIKNLPDVGSSSKRTGGLTTNSTATETRFLKGDKVRSQCNQLVTFIATVVLTFRRHSHHGRPKLGFQPRYLFDAKDPTHRESQVPFVERWNPAWSTGS